LTVGIGIPSIRSLVERDFISEGTEASDTTETELTLQIGDVTLERTVAQ